MTSAWKSSPKTAKKNRTGPDPDWSRPQIIRTGKDRNRGLVFGLSQIWKFQDQEKTSLTSLNQSLHPRIALEVKPRYVQSFITFYSISTNKFCARHYTSSSTCPIFGRYQLSSSTTNNVVDHCQPPPRLSSLASPSHFLSAKGLKFCL